MVSPLCLERPTMVANSNGDPVLRLPRQARRNLEGVADWFLTMGADRDDHSLLRDIYWTGVAIEMKVRKFVSFPSITPAFKERATVFLLKEMAGLAVENGGQLVVIYIPAYDNASPSVASPTTYSHVVEEAGGVFVDMAGVFNRMRERGKKIGIPGDGHMASGAHEAIAETIFARLGGTGR